MSAGRDTGFILLSLVLSIAFLAFIFSLLPVQYRTAAVPDFAWAPGYWEYEPPYGIVRTVPMAKTSLVSPAASAAPPDAAAEAASVVRQPDLGAGGDFSNEASPESGHAGESFQENGESG